MTLIGLAGYARSGKDSVGQILVEELNFTRAAFADTLRSMALAIDPYVAPCLRLSELVHASGWEGAKKYPEVRRLLQHIGTEAVRNHLGQNAWVDALMLYIEEARVASDDSTHVAVTDVRFVNEAEAIKARGGEVWRVHRPGVEAINAHESERALDGFGFDVDIHNDGTLEELRSTVLFHCL